jgi:hypothetical protein
MVTKELWKEPNDRQVDISDYEASSQPWHNKELKSNYNAEHWNQCAKKIEIPDQALQNTLRKHHLQ